MNTNTSFVEGKHGSTELSTPSDQVSNHFFVY